MSDTDLVGVLWRAATSVVPNMRMFDSIERLRGEIELVTGSSLPEPTWWAAKKEQHRLAVGKTKTVEAPVPAGDQLAPAGLEAEPPTPPEAPDAE